MHYFHLRTRGLTAAILPCTLWIGTHPRRARVEKINERLFRIKSTLLHSSYIGGLFCVRATLGGYEIAMTGD